MQRTFNYTGRKKIDSHEALFSFSGSEEKPAFDVIFNFDEKLYPDDASLYVEAYYKETRQRYSFGKIAGVTPPKDRLLSQIDLSGATLFRVLIVDESGSHGMLLASGEGFRADKVGNEDKERSSILTVASKPLGQLTWKVEFETGGIPELLVNNSIPNAIEKIRSDPVFQSLILPAALRQVLMYYLWNDCDDQEDEVYDRWMEFSENFVDVKPDSKDPLTLMDWIDEVVLSFSAQFDMCDRLLHSIKEEQ